MCERVLLVKCWSSNESDKSGSSAEHWSALVENHFTINFSPGKESKCTKMVNILGNILSRSASLCHICNSAYTLLKSAFVLSSIVVLFYWLFCPLISKHTITFNFPKGLDNVAVSLTFWKYGTGEILNNTKVSEQKIPIIIPLLKQGSYLVSRRVPELSSPPSVLMHISRETRPTWSWSWDNGTFLTSASVGKNLVHRLV